MRALLLALVAVFLHGGSIPPQRFVLSNGLTVVLLEAHEHPLLRAWFHVSLAPADQPPTCPDLPGLFLSQLERADHGERKAWEWDRDLEAQGIQFQATANPAGLDWRLLARSRDQDRALGLMADVLLRSILNRSSWTPSCGLSWEDLQAFGLRILRPDRTLLVLHGDLGLEQAKQLALLSLGTWPPSPGPRFVPPAFPGSPEVQALWPFLVAPGQTKHPALTKEDLDRARSAWRGRQNLRTLSPEAEMAQALDEVLGRAARPDRMDALMPGDLNR